MGKFMVNIQLEGLETYIKLDMSGIYMVIIASDSDDVHSKLSILPYYPFMRIEIISIRMVNHINQ